jgi:cytochrome b6-f complex iron-sulfur subunit
MAKDKSGKLGRRQFLGLMWWGAAGVLALQVLGATLLSLWPRTKAGAFGGIFRVPLSEVPQQVGDINDSYVITGLFYLTRVQTSDGGSGLLALYRRCTHLGCVVPWLDDEVSEDNLASKGRFNCPCHGSIFDRYGLVHGGPAPRPLDLLAAEVQGDDLLIDTGNIIQRATFEDSQVARI